MFNRGIRLPFKLLGIPILLDWSFLLILPIMAYLIGTNTAQLAAQMGLEVDAVADPASRYLLGLIAAIGLFVCVLLHELGHAVAARWYGIEVERISLWFLGGVAQMSEIPRQRGGEAVMAIAGPIVSIALGVGLWVLFPLVPDGYPSTKLIVGYLAMLNVVLAVFNMIPALPLDGGRVLRSLLALAMPFHQATRICGVISKVLAVLLGIVGLFTNIFLLFIAFFIYMAVSAENQMGRLEAVLRGVPVRRLMNPEVHAVRPGTRVGDLLQQMLAERHLGFPVIDEYGRLRGTVSLDQVQHQDPNASVESVMSPGAAVVYVHEDGVSVLRHMGKNGLARVLVLGPGDEVVGIITKGDLMRFIMVREAIAGLSEDASVRPMGEPWSTRTPHTA